MVRNVRKLGEYSKVKKSQSLARMLTSHLSVNSELKISGIFPKVPYNFTLIAALFKLKLHIQCIWNISERTGYIALVDL